MFRAWVHAIAAVSRQLCHSTRGGVALIGALSLTTIVGMGAFAVEASQGYAVDTQNQRVADMAALAGALAYNVNSNTTQMTATARAVVAAQGLPASSAAVALVTDAATSKQLVQVTVTTAVPLSLGRVFTSALSYDVAATGAATTMTTASVTPPCIAALSATPAIGITQSGNSTVTASGCAINSNAGYSVAGSSQGFAKQLNLGKSFSKSGSASVTTTPTAADIVQNKANAASDWMLADTNLAALLCKVNLITGDSDPDYADGNRSCTTPVVTPPAASGPAWDFNYSPSAALAPYRSGNTYTVPASAVPASLSSITVAGNITATIVGPVNLTVGSISVSGSGTLHVGSGNLTVTNGIDVQGSAYVDFDTGVGNTVTIGGSVTVAGSAKFCFTANCTAPNAAAGTFSVGGSFTSQGSSTTIFPKAAIHVIANNLDLKSNTTFGSGSYIIGNNFSNTSSGTMTGVDVTFALGRAFSLSGSSSLDIAAPGVASGYGIPGILMATKTTSGTSIAGSSNARFDGLFYAPKSPLSISGSATIWPPGSGCLMMIVSTLDIQGSAAATTGTCSSLTTSGPTPSVALFR